VKVKSEVQNKNNNSTSHVRATTYVLLIFVAKKERPKLGGYELMMHDA